MKKFVNDWHYFLLDVQEVLYNAEDPDLIRNLNLFVVNRSISNHMIKIRISTYSFMRD